MQGSSPATAFRIRRYSGEAEWCVLRTRSGRFRLRATYFLLVQKVGKDTFRGKNTDSTSGAEKRALAHSIFPLKTPDFYGDAIKKCVRLLPARGNRIPCYLYLSLPLQWRLL